MIPMAWTLVGIVMDVSPDLEKAKTPLNFNEHYDIKWAISIPIFVTLEGIVMDLREVQPSKLL